MAEIVARRTDRRELIADKSFITDLPALSFRTRYEEKSCSLCNVATRHFEQDFSSPPRANPPRFVRNDRVVKRIGQKWLRF
jgi:hypothetical protein